MKWKLLLAFAVIVPSLLLVSQQMESPHAQLAEVARVAVSD